MKEQLVVLVLALGRAAVALECIVCGDYNHKNPYGRAADCLAALRDPATAPTAVCNNGWCESQFKRGSETPYTMRCVEGDPTKEKVTWSPYALINPEKNIWCQWPAFGLADVRCVCQQEDRCNNLDKPGRGNRKSAASASSLSLSLLSLVMVILTASLTL